MKTTNNKRHLRVGHCYILVLILLSMLLLTGCNSNESFNEQKVVRKIDSSLDRVVRNSEGDINRHALLFIDAPTLDFRYSGAAGVARVDTGEPLTPDWQFFIASVGKSMTAVIIYQMVEEGAFGSQGVDATLASLEILPPEVLFDLHIRKGVSRAEKITLRHLLTHTTGLRDLFFDGVDNPVSLMPGTPEGAAPDSLIGLAAFDEQYGLTPLVRCTLESIPAGCNPDDYLFRHRWIPWDYEAWQTNTEDKNAGMLNFYLSGMNDNALWEPGEGFHYSDTNYILLGLVIEKLTGNSLHHELRTRIFDPLGMDDTYLIGATNPPADNYEKQLAEAWAWGEPTISGGVDFSFDWGGGGIVSTLENLHTFIRALMTGRLFQEIDTLDQMLAVPEDVHGISYASGLIVFPSDEGTISYMMGSNGTWVEYYPPLDLVMIGTIDDFSNMPGQFQLHIELYQILANHGLNTPMARIASLPMLLGIFGIASLMILGITWLSVAFLQKHKKEFVSALVKKARWLTVAAFLVNLVMMGVIGMTFGGNIFQMMFGFSSQVRNLFVITACLMAIFGLIMVILGVILWKNRDGKAIDRLVLTAIAMVTLVYAISLAALGL
jgi:D-alanyl-D-alanine carboxypeptidase